MGSSTAGLAVAAQTGVSAKTAIQLVHPGCATPIDGGATTGPVGGCCGTTTGPDGGCDTDGGPGGGGYVVVTSLGTGGPKTGPPGDPLTAPPGRKAGSGGRN